MVHFEQNFQKQQIEQFKTSYLDYQKLKTFLKVSLQNLLKSSDRTGKEKEQDLNQIDKLASGSSSIESKYLKEEGEAKINIEDEKNKFKEQHLTIEDVLNEFIKGLDKEIKKIYLCFVNKERDLYVQINSHLHIREQYDSFNLLHISKEFEELNKLSVQTFNLSKFVNDNMLALHKVLQKFDKKFEYFCGRISLQYIQQKIAMKNSDLLYVLQFKIVDEASALLEELMNDLWTKFEAKKINGNTDTLRQGLMHPADDFALNEKEMFTLIHSYRRNLETNINLIDQHYQNFKINFKEWNVFLKTRGITVVNSGTQETSLCGLTINFNRNTGYQQIKTQSNKKENFTDMSQVLSKENRINIFLTLLHSFLFQFCFSIVLVTNKSFVSSIVNNAHYSGLIMSLTPLGSLLSLFYTNKLTKSSFKLPMILSVIALVLGNLLYCLSGPLNSIILMGAGRLILGFGSNRVANRSYLIRFVPKARLTLYLTYFQLCSITGLAAGLLFSVPVMYLHDFDVDMPTNSIFNIFTNPSWVALIVSLIVLMISVFIYNEPLQSNFGIYKEDIDLNETASNYSTVRHEALSKNEESMIEEINDRLSEVNDKNKFSDTNFVSKSIEQVIWREHKTSSYIYKCFITFVAILFVVRMTTESLLIISPYYIQDMDPNFDLKLVACFMGVSVLLVIPLWYIYAIFVGTKVGDRRLMLCLVIASIVFNVLILNLFYTSLIQYCVVFVFLMITATVLENVATTLFAKIIPGDYQLFGGSVGMLIQIGTTIGRFLGALMLTLAGFTTDENLNRITYGITLLIFIVVLVVVISMYPNLRVKAIARIMRAKAYRKLKKAEF